MELKRGQIERISDNLFRVEMGGKVVESSNFNDIVEIRRKYCEEQGISLNQLIERQNVAKIMNGGFKKMPENNGKNKPTGGSTTGSAAARRIPEYSDMSKLIVKVGEKEKYGYTLVERKIVGTEPGKQKAFDIWKTPGGLSYLVCYSYSDTQGRDILKTRDMASAKAALDKAVADEEASTASKTEEVTSEAPAEPETNETQEPVSSELDEETSSEVTDEGAGDEQPKAEKKGGKASKKK